MIAHIQVRLGPSRVGPHGLLQPLADVIKLLTKEDLIPPQANKFLYVLAPFLAVSLAMLPIAVIPFGPEVEIFGIHTSIQLTDLNIGVLFLLAISSLGVYGIALAGWASNSKYSLLGGLRSVGADDQLRTAAGAGRRRSLAALQHAEPEGTGGVASRLLLRAGSRTGTYSACRLRSWSASRFS